MRHHAGVYFAMTVILSACTGSEVDIEVERAGIRAREEALVAAESAMDTQGSLAFWAPDGIVQGHGVPQAGGRREVN